MNKSGIIKFCKELGCCDACCLRYIGITPTYYNDAKNVVQKFENIQSDEDNSKAVSPSETTEEKNSDNNQNSTEQTTAVVTENNDNLSKTDHGINQSTTQNEIEPSLDANSKNNSDGTSNDNVPSSEAAKENGDRDMPQAKRCKLDICCSCLGVLQGRLLSETFEMVKEILDKKRYDCPSFACALSTPMAIILREKSIVLRISDKFENYDASSVTPLKEAWKWTVARKLAGHIDKLLDSGAVSPLLITLNYDYPDDVQELEILKAVAPWQFAERPRGPRYCASRAIFTRRSVDQALEKATLEELVAAGGGLPSVTLGAQCVSVVCNHNPIYLGGRYIKLSRALPQTPWVLDGRRMMPSSVQDIIFEPIAAFYGFDAEQAKRRLKFIGAGREDVDVRCLGDGRPFALEITDPQRQLTADELSKACAQIAASGDVIVQSLVPISKDDLAQLKTGEETKCKTYEALCVKLTHSKYDDVPPDAPVTVTDDDIRRINEYRNTAEGDPWKIRISQKTPIRVLHRRPLLTRIRGILDLEACKVPGHPSLIRTRVRTTAGAYVKEWACGELGRTRPSLAEPLRARVEMVALDVREVHLSWPPESAA